MISSKSITLFETKDYSVRLEYNKNYVIIHLPHIYKMTKEVFQDMQFRLDDWYTFFATMGHTSIWAAIAPDNKKMERLLSMLEFKFIGTADGMSVFEYKRKSWVQH